MGHPSSKRRRALKAEFRTPKRTREEALAHIEELYQKRKAELAADPALRARAEAMSDAEDRVYEALSANKTIKPDFSTITGTLEKLQQKADAYVDSYLNAEPPTLRQRQKFEKAIDRYAAAFKMRYPSISEYAQVMCDEMSELAARKGVELGPITLSPQLQSLNSELYSGKGRYNRRLFAELIFRDIPKQIRDIRTELELAPDKKAPASQPVRQPRGDA
jgi:hypothetical protein